MSAYVFLADEPITDIENGITGEAIPFYSLDTGTPKTTWKHLVEHSKQRIKNYPDWVKNSAFSEHDKRHGFMLGGNFFAPVYSLFIDGERHPYYQGYSLISDFAWQHMKQLTAQGKKVDIRLTAFVECTEANLYPPNSR